MPSDAGQTTLLDASGRQREALIGSDQGEGVFATPNGMMIKTFGLDGRPLSADALDPKSYLVGLTVNANASGMVGAAMQRNPWDVVKAASANIDGGKVLDGTIALNVNGGAFSCAARFTYPHRMDPDIDLTCR